MLCSFISFFLLLKKACFFPPHRCPCPLAWVHSTNPVSPDLLFLGYRPLGPLTDLKATLLLKLKFPSVAHWRHIDSSSLPWLYYWQFRAMTIPKTIDAYHAPHRGGVNGEQRWQLWYQWTASIIASRKTCCVFMGTNAYIHTHNRAWVDKDEAGQIYRNFSKIFSNKFFNNNSHTITTSITLKCKLK